MILDRPEDVYGHEAGRVKLAPVKSIREQKRIDICSGIETMELGIGPSR